MKEDVYRLALLRVQQALANHRDGIDVLLHVVDKALADEQIDDELPSDSNIYPDFDI